VKAQQALLSEVKHRVKNMLASAVSIASRTLRTSPSLEAFGLAFEGRIYALARAHDLIAANTWQGVDVTDLLRAGLAPYGEIGSRIRLSGTGFTLSADQAMAFAMIVQELVANAEKHGALSNSTGWLEVRWSASAGQKFVLDWSERGGPPVTGGAPPWGFGMELIERSTRSDLHGAALCDFGRDGVHWRIEMPLREAKGSSG